MKNKQLNDNRGQVLTEYLIILIVLIVVIFVHIHFSLNYVISHIAHYASFMAARTEMVRPGQYSNYLNPLIRAIQWIPTATVTPSLLPSSSGTGKSKVVLEYQLANPILFGKGVNFFDVKSISEFSYEPQFNDVKNSTLGVLDNEIP